MTTTRTRSASRSGPSDTEEHQGEAGVGEEEEEEEEEHHQEGDVHMSDTSLAELLPKGDDVPSGPPSVTSVTSATSDTSPRGRGRGKTGGNITPTQSELLSTVSTNVTIIINNTRKVSLFSPKYAGVKKYFN